jgi:hypothetical protein
MKANFPNQRAMKTRNTIDAMTAPRTPRNPVIETSVLGGLKCDSKAVWETENKIPFSTTVKFGSEPSVFSSAVKKLKN